MARRRTLSQRTMMRIAARRAGAFSGSNGDHSFIHGLGIVAGLGLIALSGGAATPFVLGAAATVAGVEQGTKALKEATKPKRTPRTPKPPAPKGVKVTESKVEAEAKRREAEAKRRAAAYQKEVEKAEKEAQAEVKRRAAALKKESQANVEAEGLTSFLKETRSGAVARQQTAADVKKRLAKAKRDRRYGNGVGDFLKEMR
jgi:hypothetical protein